MYCGGLVFGRCTCYVTAMGHVYQRVKLGAVNEEDLTILVDTGATLSLIPPALADRLGITRLPRKQVIVLADGRRIEAEVGVVMVEIGDRKTAHSASTHPMLKATNRWRPRKVRTNASTTPAPRR